MQEAKKVKFRPHGPLRAELVKRVDAYFEETGLPKTGGGTVAFKFLFFVSILVTAFTLMVTVAGPWWQVVACAAVVGVTMSAIGFTVQHDSNHEATTNSKLLNRLGGFSLDLMGGSSYMWRYKHNILHHTWPNVVGVDDDIEAQPFLRLAPEQTRYWFHRFQHLYVAMIYSFLLPKWHFLDDYKSLVTGKINGYKIARPKGWDLVLLLLGKLLFYGWMFALPLALGHSGLWVLGAYAVACSFSGILLATTFQLAHCVSEADFMGPTAVQQTWAEHQLATTINFAAGSSVVTWLVGGLNHQVEHHLFPRICHVHYTALYKIVDHVCDELGVERQKSLSLWSAVGSHLGYLRRLGQPSPPAVAGAGAKSQPAPAVPVA